MSVDLIVMPSPINYIDAERYSCGSGVSVEQLLLSQLTTGVYEPGEDQLIEIALNGKDVPSLSWRSTMVNDGDQLIVSPRVHDPLSIAAAVIAVASVYYAYNIDIPINDEIIPESSPSYEADPQGNRARLDQPIPEYFGRFRVWPSYASSPIQETENNDKIGYYLFSIGEGSYDISDVKIGETSIANFEDAEYIQYQPGQRVTLVPTAAYSATEVGGSGIALYAPNEPDYSGESGPFLCNQNNTLAHTLLFDFSFSQGLGYINKKGRLQSRSVRIRIDYRLVGDVVWQSSEHVFADATTDPLRFTRRIADLPLGQYEARVVRLNSSADDIKEKDEIRWTGLRAYLDDDQVFDETTLAVRIRVTAQLSAISRRKINCIVNRRLPVWDVDSQSWLPSSTTRNLVWAFCYVLKRAGYNDSNFRDLDALAVLAAEYDRRNDYFDGGFESLTNVWAALQRIAKAGRAIPINYGDSFHLVRDDDSPGNEYQFIGRNTVKNSFSLSWKTVDEWQDDSVIVEYVNPETWKKEDIVCALPGVTPFKPQRVGLIDTTNQQQAHREGMFLVAKRAYRNVVASLNTLTDGKNPYLFDRLFVASALPRWGYCGEVEQVRGQRLWLSESVEFVAGREHYIWFRQANGQNSNSYQCIPARDDNNNIIDGRVDVIESLPGWIYTGFDYEKTYFAFASGDDQPRRMLLTQARPDADGKVSMTAELDDPRVYQFDALVDDGSISAPPPALVAPSIDLTIRQVQVVHGGTVDEPQLQINWAPVGGAQQYFVGIRYSDAVNWRRVYEGSEPQARINVAPGGVYVRIAAMGEVVGQWFETGLIDAGNEFAVPTTPSGFRLAVPFVGMRLLLEWQDDVAAVEWRVDYLDGNGQVRYSKVVSEPEASLSADVAVLNGLGRSIVCRVYGINAEGVVSSVPAELTAVNPQIASLTGVLSIVNVNILHLRFDLPADEDFAGVVVFNGAPGFDPVDSFRVKQTDSAKSSIDIAIVNPAHTAVRIAAFDVWGDDDLNLSVEILDVSAGLRASGLHSSLSQRIDQIDAPGTGLIDRLGAEVAASQSGRSSLQSQIDSLQVSSSVPIFIQADEPVGSIDENSRWFDADDNNRPYIYQGGVWVDVTDQRILDNAAAIQSESLVRANEVGAVAGQVTTLQTTFDNQISSIQQSLAAVSSDVDGVKLEYSLKLDVDGYVVGYGQFNDGPGDSGFIIRADKFGIANPSSPDFYPFVFDSSTGNLFVRSAYIPDLDVGKITGDVSNFVVGNIGDANITRAMVQDGAIDNAKIGSEIRSNNYSSSAGWLINKNGSAVFRNVYVRGNVEATSLRSATGTFSGVLTASAVNAIDTVNIRGNAVVVPTVVSSLGTIRFSNWGTVLSASHSGVRRPVFLSFYCDLHSVTGDSERDRGCGLRLLLDGSVVEQYEDYQGSSGGLVYHWAGVLPADTTSIVVQLSNRDSRTCSRRRISVIEGKR